MQQIITKVKERRPLVANQQLVLSTNPIPKTNQRMMMMNMMMIQLSILMVLLYRTEKVCKHLCCLCLSLWYTSDPFIRCKQTKITTDDTNIGSDDDSEEEVEEDESENENENEDNDDEVSSDEDSDDESKDGTSNLEDKDSSDDEIEDSIHHSESDGKSGSDTEDTNDPRGPSWNTITDLMLANEVDVVQVKFEGKRKTMRYHPTGSEKERKELRKLVQNPPENVKYWKVWSHQNTVLGLKEKVEPAKKLPKGQQTLKGEFWFTLCVCLDMSVLTHFNVISQNYDPCR